MAGVWKKTLNYLGLVEDDEEFVDDMPEVEPAPVRRMKPQAVRGMSSETEGVVRTISSPRHRLFGHLQIGAEAVQRSPRGGRPVQGRHGGDHEPAIHR